MDSAVYDTEWDLILLSGNIFDVNFALDSLKYVDRGVHASDIWDLSSQTGGGISVIIQHRFCMCVLLCSALIYQYINNLH